MDILITAYTNLNLGDDLFIKILCDRYKEINFKITATESTAISLKKIKNLEVITSKSKFGKRFLRKINKYVHENIIAKKTDATVNIGGSIFIQSKKWKFKKMLYQLLIFNSKKFYILGANFGPFNEKQYLADYAKIFKKVNDVSFRDKKSYDLFSNLSTVRLAPDIVFGLDTEEITTKETASYMTISVMNIKNREGLKEYAVEYENAIIKICQSLIEREYKIILMSFCANEGDEDAVKRILTQVNTRYVQPYYYRGNLEEALEVLKSSKGIVATRFHALILAWVFQKPVFPLIYSSKTTNAIRDINFQGYSLNIKDIKHIDIEKVLQQLTTETYINLYDSIEESKKHFSRLDYFIKNGQ